MRPVITTLSLLASLALTSQALALEPPKEGSVIFLLGNVGGPEPFGVELILEVEDAIAASITPPDGESIPLTFEDGEFTAESDLNALLADLLDGTGAPGNDTWTLSVVFPGAVTGTYSFSAQLENITESNLAQPSLILSPADGVQLTEAPAALIWNEPANAALADLVIVGVEGFVPGTGQVDVVDLNTLDGSLTLNPASNLESVAIPGPLDPGFYNARVEYIRFLDPVDLGLSAITTLTGPTVNWGLPPEAGGLTWPAGAPLTAATGFAEHQFEIVEIILPGDFNDSGDLTASDLDLLYQAVRFGTFDNAFDLDGDTFIDAFDLNFWLGLFGSAAGDGNLDQRVDLIDLSTLASNFGTGVGTYSDGDFNADGVVDLIDLSTLASNFGFDATTIPEPAAASLGLLGLTLLRRRR